jgi:ATP-dependent Lhr-like helicase
MESAGPGLLEFLGPSPSPELALAALTEPLRRWFAQSFVSPTVAQRLAWPALVSGKNLLLCAPTGSGKTLAAFLPIVDRLLHDPVSSGVRCLYVSPLKALGNDARKNLRAHLHGIRSFLPPNHPRLRVALRTGDTSAKARRALWRQPPDLFLTTPESLAVLLSQSAAADLFRELNCVIVDEVHALVPNKRGADLALSLERLAALVRSPLQRIGLSATCAPLTEAARHLVGATHTCAIAAVAETDALELAIEPLEESERGFLARLVDRLDPELAANRTTLIFTNVRSLAERLVWTLRRRYPAWAEQIAVHHSALAAARRRLVERRLKQGRLRVVVSSTSLELGIDIGTVDAVILVHPPGAVVRLLQRIGRAGHAPGRARRGLVLTATAAELLEATVTGASSLSAQYEPLRGPHAPRDVLCQQLLGMAAQQAWSADGAFALVRQAHPYRDLPRGDFDRCLEYLSGRRSDGQPWLPARLRWQDGRFVIADQRTARLVRRNLGTILTEEPRPVKQLQSEGPGGSGEGREARLVGEVEDAFADRLQPGDRFLLDGRCLEFRRREDQALLVEEVVGRPVVPRWGGEGWPLSTELARRLYLLRVRAAEALRDGPRALVALLHDEYGLGEAAVAALVAHFQRQEWVSEIPDATTCLIEVVSGETGEGYYVHTPLNRAGNDALARVAVHRLVRDRGQTVTSIVADLGFALVTSGPILTVEGFRALLSPVEFDPDLDQALADSLTLRERFRRVALTGLMLLRQPLGRRRRVGGPEWAERRLFEQVRAGDPDCILLQQALREVRQECCDAGAARHFLEELPRRALHWRQLPAVSPFAASWTQRTAGPAETGASPSEALERLHAVLTQEGEASPDPDDRAAGSLQIPDALI